MISVIPPRLTFLLYWPTEQQADSLLEINVRPAVSYWEPMEICRTCPSISEEDLRAARAELKAYVDVTDEDLMKIYVLAVRNARERRSTMVMVQNVMTENVVTVTPDMSIHEAARLLSEHKITGLPVVDEKNHVIGVLSMADILPPEGSKKENAVTKLLLRLRGKQSPPRFGEERVGGAMSAPPITTGPDADVKEVAAVLDLHRIKRLPVVDDDGKLLGIISRGDIVRAMGKKL